MSEIVYIHLHQTLIGGQLPTTVLQKYLQADQAVVLLIHVQIFHKTFSQEVIKSTKSILELLHVMFLDSGHTVICYDQWAADTPSI
jgi:hypothetical protein